MELYPAIDIRGGQAVRLTRGDFSQEDTYGDPLSLARQFASAGAPWLHVVDLDAARSGEPVNRATVLAIAAAVSIPVEVGGGVRSEADVDELLAGGVRRVVLGTLAIDDPGRARRLAELRPGRLAVGIDYRVDPAGHTEVASRGWERGSGRSVAEVVGELEGAELGALVVTAIGRDGTLEGPDLAGAGQVLAATDLPVLASGGVGSVADLEALAGLAVRSETGALRRLAGAITGRALVEGRLTVEEGVAACARSG